MTPSSPYPVLLSKKRAWAPCQVTAGSIAPGALPTLRRALALRHLELPVKELLQQGLDRELPSTPGIREILISNQADEERHDLALNYVTDAHGVDPEAEKVALQFREAFLSHPDHPLLKTAIVERSIFFVILPMFRFLGDKGMRTTSGDISLDERVHASSHTMIAQELKQRPSASLNKFRKEIAAWVTELLPSKAESKFMDRGFWRSQSDELYSRGTASGLKATRSTVMPAFFEASNCDLPSYG